nr:uncharacterized protein LOC121124036 [Lepeophtheirus salmonis]
MDLEFKSDRRVHWHYLQLDNKRQVTERIKSLKTELVDLKMRKLELLSKNMDLSQISSSRDQLQFLNTIRGYYIEDKKNGNTVIHFNDATKSSLVLNKKNFLVSINIPKNIARLDIGFHVRDKHEFAHEIYNQLKSYESRRLQAQKMTDMYHGKGLFQVQNNRSFTNIIIGLNITDESKNKITIQVNFRYKKNSYRPSSIRVIDMSDTLSEEDLEILLEQCSVFNNYQLDVALGKSFLSL